MRPTRRLSDLCLDFGNYFKRFLQLRPLTDDILLLIFVPLRGIYVNSSVDCHLWCTTVSSCVLNEWVAIQL